MMDFEIQELNSNVLGRKLGQKLFSPKGSLLLGMGAEIKEFHYQKIKEVGYQSIYVLKDDYSDVLKSSGHLISEKLRASAPLELKGIYRKLMSKDKISISNGKKELSSMADTLIREVNIKMTNPPDIIDLKRQEDYLYQHAINVAAYSILIAQSVQYHQLKLFDVTLAALLCDFGMHYVDEEILYKPEPLDEKEIEEMRKHTILGFQYLGRNCFIKGLVTVVCLQHHERYDGSGYPKHMSGDDIHEYSRIVSIADFFDAYTSDRPYRRLHSIEEGIEYLKEPSGREFDPRILRHFLSFFE